MLAVFERQPGVNSVGLREREPSDSNFILRETVGVSSVRLREKAQCKHYYT